MFAPENPKVSVIIPAYNQAQFLAAAIESVLAQTYHNYEIIVIDDGSTDQTAAVAQQFGNRIQYIYQSNLGLAGARNTGIRSARGEYIGLLDSDDCWMDEFLETMIAATIQYPEAVVLFGGAICMDVEGNNLSQVIGLQNVSDQDLYPRIIRANFIIPSTVLMRRDVVSSIGMFDQNVRSCEDWDLWLRLLPRYSFHSSPSTLVRYRVHGSSLSANISRMQLSVRSVIEKNFGPDDGEYDRWPEEKKQAYAGVYRYYVLSSIQRQNNWQCEHHLLKALQIDHSLAMDDDLFYDIALGNQSLGRRDLYSEIDLEENERKISGMLMNLFGSETDLDTRNLLRSASGTAYKSLSLIAYNAGKITLSRKYAYIALKYRPELWTEKTMMGDLLKSFLGKASLSYFRELRRIHRKSKQTLI